MEDMDPENEKKQKDHHRKHDKKMAGRGVTRPMSEMKMGDKKKDDDSQNHGHEMMMDPEQKMNMLHMHHMQTLWVYWLIIILGAWVMVSPLTFSYSNETALPSGGREVWISLANRITVLKWNDIISGGLLVIFGWRALTPNRPYSMWACCFIGIWLTFAPIIFWSPSAVNYLNDTLVGAFIIALTILIPGMPNMILHMQMGPETPPGWSYNPSSWPQRSIMIGLAFIGWLVSRYLAAFQLGYIDQVWDPFFGNSTEQVLNSKMSHSMPISDAGFGAIAYTIEFMMGWMGSPKRWRTMPWMVTFFGILVIPLGLVHIFLVASQPVMVGFWCTFCLLAAAIMLPMIPLQVDEVIAMGQFMKKAKQKGESLWKVFWMGGTVEGGGEDERSPEVMQFPDQPGKVFKASIWGMSFPWTLTLTSAIGFAIIFAPNLFGVRIQEMPANITHLSGLFIIVFSILAMGEPIRTARFINVLIGLGLAGSLWFVQGSPTGLNITGLVAGIMVAALSIPRGPVTEKYAGWNEYIK